MGSAGKDVGGVIQAMITMLCGIVFLVCILRQQHYIQLQNQQIQRLREVLALRDEQLEVYENLHREQARQIALLKEYAALLRQEAGRE